MENKQKKNSKTKHHHRHQQTRQSSCCTPSHLSTGMEVLRGGIKVLFGRRHTLTFLHTCVVIIKAMFKIKITHTLGFRWRFPGCKSRRFLFNIGKGYLNKIVFYSE